MIIVSGGTKGGDGKSTMATQLAVSRALSGRDVALVDTDSQGSSYKFTLLRAERRDGGSGYTCVKVEGKGARTEVQNLAPKFGDIVIDAGARDTLAQRYAFTVADRVLIPCVPSTFDVWAMQENVAIIEEARAINPDLRALVYLNRAESQGSENDEAAELLREVEGIEFSGVTIVDRKAFRHATSAGLALSELDSRRKDPKAQAELERLFNLAFDIEETSARPPEEVTERSEEREEATHVTT